jgi:hypothetical protein
MNESRTGRPNVRTGKRLRAEKKSAKTKNIYDTRALSEVIEEALAKKKRPPTVRLTPTRA